MKFMFSAAAAAAILGASLAAPAQAQLAYSENFESLSVSDPNALSNSGWLIFGNVYDSAGTFLFPYGPFGAPNGGPAFSAVVDDQGGASQGDRQLSIYSDYNCCQPSNGHFNGTDLVESSVFQEFTIVAADVGITYVFFFEAKKGNIDGATTANAFIKTLDPNAGFATTNFIEQNTTSTPDVWKPYILQITIDAPLVGQLLQIGFSSTSSNFQGSGVFYDNLSLAPFVDTDGDGVPDIIDNCPTVGNPGQSDIDNDGLGDNCDDDDDGDGVNDVDDNCPGLPNPDQANNDGDAQGDFCDPDDDNDSVNDTTDNCTFVANPGQEDANGDSIGNICDPDVTGPGDVEDCSVNFLDLSAFKAGFFGTDPELNLDGAANVNFADLNIVKAAFFGPPGPSAAGCN